MRRDNIVTAADYPDLSYFSPAGESQPVAELLKAITAGTGSDSSLFTGGRSLVMESLDDTLADVLWSDKHVKLFKALRASSLGATVDEWVTRSSYGSAWGVAVGETGNPPISEADLARQIDTVSYYRSRREVSHVMTLMRSIESAEVEEEQAGTRQILGRLETDLFTGDRDVFPERVKGLLAHAVEQGGDLLRDAHGAAVNKQDLFHELAGVVYNEGGALTQVLHNPICQADIDAALQPAQRLVIPVQAADGTVRVGATQRSLATAHGDVMFDADRFVRGGWTIQAPSEAQGPDAPGTPTINSVTG
ncbi:MAG: hypothetical protein U9R79_22855, partial [Armatimonadota bacterium]|nr:hypothetical protein [Armatimonadota bacterium]